MNQIMSVCLGSHQFSKTVVQRKNHIVVSFLILFDMIT